MRVEIRAQVRVAVVCKLRVELQSRDFPGERGVRHHGGGAGVDTDDRIRVHSAADHGIVRVIIAVERGHAVGVLIVQELHGIRHVSAKALAVIRHRNVGPHNG